MKSQSKPEAAIKLGKIVDDAVFNRIVADLNRYDRLSDFYADQEAAARTLGDLVAAGVINDKQLQARHCQPPERSLSRTRLSARYFRPSRTQCA